jgi:hypothetical protein
MGYKMSIKADRIRGLLGGIVAAMLIASCSAAAASQGGAQLVGANKATNDGVASVVDSSLQGVLAECDRPDVQLGAPLTNSGVDRSRAEVASRGIGAKGSADVAVLTTVTVGTRMGQPPIPAEALRDATGAPIVDRPAWVLVFRNQRAKTPSIYYPGLTFSPPPPVTVLASVVDARTGTFLRGWGCAR